ncbi:MAG: sigma 54-interacting transcriptional regulator [Desulfobacterales bacterium]|jgi:transcriptional regulator with GAF, ATPase, and Fis domain
MKYDPNYEPDYDSLKTLLLEMAQEHAVAPLLAMIVRQLARRPHVALARIWLIQEGDCPCPAKESTCDDKVKCLHLMASQGSPLADRNADWSRLDGEFSRLPLGARKVGWIAATGKAVEVNDIEKDSKWIARPEWARQEGILGFGGQPLLYKGEVLGVLAVFTRYRLKHEELVWMRMIADHAATAIINARAFEKIQRLQEQMELECSYLREEVQDARAFGDIVGESDAMKSVLKQVELVAPTDASVIILGESGTGKELVAREIHKRSVRNDRPLIKVNCASISRELYESEFFGHVKGAFSGAIKDRAGRFEAADGGTLFLDEVGEIPLDLQSKLLRVLQEGQYERVGEEATRQVDVRIIAATNRNLKSSIEKGRFRQDLYYRLNVFPIEVAPLRLRKKDIPLLAEHFLGLIQKRGNRKFPQLSTSNLKQLQNYDWPGNVRELQNVIERAAITSQGHALHFVLPESDESDNSLQLTTVSLASQDESEVVPESEMRRRERQNVIAALQKSKWKIYGEGGAAELLGIKPTTLSSRIKKMKIRKPTI